MCPTSSLRLSILMAFPLLFDVRYDERVREGTAEYWDSWRMPEEFQGVLLFHDRAEHQRWMDGATFKLINHPSKSAPKPQYDKAERMRKKNKRTGE